MHPAVRLVAIDVDGTLLPSSAKQLTARTARALRDAQAAGITVAIATGRRVAYTAPIFEGLGLRADTPLITSNGAVVARLDGQAMDHTLMPAEVARGLCGLLRPFGSMVFTFDKPGRGALVLEDLEQTHGRIALWVEQNRNAIEVVKPMEDALADGEDPIQGMVAGPIPKMREAEQALKASPLAAQCACVRTEYPARDLSILDLLPAGISKGTALRRLAASLGVERAEVMAIGDNFNDVEMLEWAGQSILMANAARELRTLAKMRGWKQTPSSDEDGVAVVLEKAIAKVQAARREGGADCAQAISEKAGITNAEVASQELTNSELTNQELANSERASQELGNSEPTSQKRAKLELANMGPANPDATNIEAGD